MLDDGYAVAQAAACAGVDVRLDVFPEVQHVFQYCVGAMPEADDAVSRIANWIRLRTGASRSREARRAQAAGTAFGGSMPTYRAWGRMILLSAACSSTWADQPTMRLVVKVAVNISWGMPARCSTIAA